MSADMLMSAETSSPCPTGLHAVTADGPYMMHCLSLSGDHFGDDYNWYEACGGCFSNGSCSYWTVFSTIATMYISLGVLMHLISWYRFVMAWGLIRKIHRIDLQLVKNKAGQRLKRSLSQLIHVDSMMQSNCPICLIDFDADEKVTACDDGGCGTWFHKDCLFEWLHHHSSEGSCPCCRKELIVVPDSCGSCRRQQQPGRGGWMADLSAYLGYTQ